MKTKIIPFDLEMAIEIQKGKIEGKIKTRNGSNIRIICFDRKSTPSIVALVGDYEDTILYYASGRFLEKGESGLDIMLEVPDNEARFKPFDKVLVRNIDTTWTPALFSQYCKIGFRVIGGEICTYCIPYEGNEHLVGTTNKPKED